LTGCRRAADMFAAGGGPGPYETRSPDSRRDAVGWVGLIGISVARKRQLSWRGLRLLGYFRDSLSKPQRIDAI
jgi:hypothetical protein